MEKLYCSIKANKKNIGNIICIGGVFLVMMLNLNTIELFNKVADYNYYITAAIITIVAMCYTNIKQLIHDKLFYICIAIDAIAVLNLVIMHSFITTFWVVYSFTLIIYLSDKITFSIQQLLIVSGIIAAFFVYWSIDVKGYYKGYTTNFGGLVLIAGFVALILILEYGKYYILNMDCKNAFLLFIKKYPYYITFVELVVFVWGFKIMAWYQSRTAVLCLVLFAVIISLPKKIVYNKRFSSVGICGVILGMILFPYIYLKISDSGILSGIEVFSKPLLSARYDNWKFLIEMLTQHPLMGNGTIFVAEGTTFRPGLLDTCNGFLQLAVPNGLVVSLLLIIGLVYSLIMIAAKLKRNPISTTAFGGIVTLIVASMSESFIDKAPFMLIFGALVFVCNSITETVPYEVSDTIDIYKELFKTEYGKRFISVACVTILVTLMYFILGPLEIFYSNHHEFEFNSWDFIWRLIGLSLFASVCIPLIVAGMPKIIARIYASVGLGFGIASYVQYMFINGDLVDEMGQFDIDVNVNGGGLTTGLYFGIIIITAIILLFIANENGDRIIPLVSLGMTMVMGTAIVAIAIGLARSENNPRTVYMFDSSDEFKFGSRENTIVLLIDTWGREELENHLKDNPDELDFLHDFTYYNKMDSVYAPTFPSLIHLLTEMEYESTEIPSVEWMENAFNSEKSKAFFDTIKTKGYRTGIYTLDIPEKYYAENIADNVKKGGTWVNRKVVTKTLVKMSIYRYMPYKLKRYFKVADPKVEMIKYEFLAPVNDNAMFKDRFTEWGMQLSEEYEKKFTISHQYGMHPNTFNDENCNRTPMDSTSREIRYSGVLKMIDLYLNDLKELGIYDSSTIILMGDHGVNRNTDAVFFMKKAGENHEEYNVNSEDLSYHDFQNIIIDTLK